MLELELLRKWFYMLPPARCRRNASGGKCEFNKGCRLLARDTEKWRNGAAVGVRANELFIQYRLWTTVTIRHEGVEGFQSELNVTIASGTGG